ncbi:MAG: hypothetical protein USCGTAYLOR_01034 [Chromatiales bacterium USCg_Taylor]|nr:MAG: hypothetical protein USCGTAYLOR_01034 [Chromatiales bacterium USCg_Taylor]
MGLDIHAARLLLYARGLGVSYRETAMVGRQTLHLSSRELHKLLGQFGYPVPVAAVNDFFFRNQGFAEPLFHLLGAQRVRSLDASDYEHATDIVDLNAPIDESYKSIFSVVIDSGSLEHVFNFPVAIKSCMQMVEPGGHFIGVVPGNNFLGHGFYQFSPELFYRIFTQANGFAVIKMFVFEDRAGATWFEVADPDRVKRRVELTNSRPTYLAVIAKKVRGAEIFATGVYQSDYVTLWEHDASPAEAYLKKLGRKFMNLVPTRLRVYYGRVQRRGLFSRFHPKLYTKADIP